MDFSTVYYYNLIYFTIVNLLLYFLFQILYVICLNSYFFFISFNFWWKKERKKKIQRLDVSFTSDTYFNAWFILESISPTSTRLRLINALILIRHHPKRNILVVSTFLNWKLAKINLWINSILANLIIRIHRYLNFL